MRRRLRHIAVRWKLDALKCTHCALSSLISIFSDPFACALFLTTRGASVHKKLLYGSVCLLPVTSVFTVGFQSFFWAVVSTSNSKQFCQLEDLMFSSTIIILDLLLFLLCQVLAKGQRMWLHSSLLHTFQVYILVQVVLTLWAITWYDCLLLVFFSRLQVLPLPNIPFFWVLFRSYSHWRALQVCETIQLVLQDFVSTCK